MSLFLQAAAKGDKVKQKQQEQKQQQASSSNKRERDEDPKQRADTENPAKRQKVSDSKDVKPPPPSVSSSSSSKETKQVAAPKTKAIAPAPAKKTTTTTTTKAVVDDSRVLLEKFYQQVTAWENSEHSNGPLNFDLLLMLYILWEVSSNKRIQSMKGAFAAWFKIVSGHAGFDKKKNKSQFTVSKIHKSERIKMLELLVARFITRQTVLDIEGESKGGPLELLVEGFRKRTWGDLNNIVEAIKQRGFATGNLAVICLELRKFNEEIKSRRNAISEQQILAYTFYLGFFYNGKLSGLFRHKQAAQINALVDYSGCLGLPLLICTDAFMSANSDDAAAALELPLPKNRQRNVLDFLYKDARGSITLLPRQYRQMNTTTSSSSSKSPTETEASKQMALIAGLACRFFPSRLRKLCEIVQTRTAKRLKFDLNAKDIIIEETRQRLFFVSMLVEKIIKPDGPKIGTTIDRLVAGFYNVKAFSDADLKTAKHLVPLNTVDPSAIYNDLEAASRWNSWCQCVRLLQEKGEAKDAKEAKAVVVAMNTSGDTPMERVTKSRALRIQVNGMEFTRVLGSSSEPLSTSDAMDPVVTAKTVTKKILINSLLASSRSETTASPLTWWTRPATTGSAPPLAIPTFCCEYTDGKWIHLAPTDMSTLLLIQAWEFDILLDIALVNNSASAEGLLSLATKPSFLKRMARTIDLHLQRRAQARSSSSSLSLGDDDSDSTERALDYRVHQYIQGMRSILEEADKKTARFAPPTIVLNPGKPRDPLYDWSLKLEQSGDVFPTTIPYCIRLLEAVHKGGSVPIPFPDTKLGDSKESSAIAASVATLLAVSRSMAKTDGLAKAAMASASIKKTKLVKPSGSAGYYKRTSFRSGSSRTQAMETGSDSDEEEEEEEDEDLDDEDEMSVASAAVAALQSRASQSIAVSKSANRNTASSTAIDAIDMSSKEAKRRKRRSKIAGRTVVELQAKLESKDITPIDKETISAKINQLLLKQRDDEERAQVADSKRAQFEKDLYDQSDVQAIEKDLALMDAVAAKMARERTALREEVRKLKARADIDAKRQELEHAVFGLQKNSNASKEAIEEAEAKLLAFREENDGAFPPLSAAEANRLAADTARLMSVLYTASAKEVGEVKMIKPKDKVEKKKKDEKKEKKDSNDDEEEEEGMVDDDVLKSVDADEEEEEEDMVDDNVLRDSNDGEGKGAPPPLPAVNMPSLQTVLDYIDYLGLPMRPHGQLSVDAQTGFEMHLNNIPPEENSMALELVASLNVQSSSVKSTLVSGLLFSARAPVFELRNKLTCAILVSRPRLTRNLTATFSVVEASAAAGNNNSNNSDSKNAITELDELNSQLEQIRQFIPGLLPPLPLQTANHIETSDREAGSGGDDVLTETAAIRNLANEKREKWAWYLRGKYPLFEARLHDEQEQEEKKNQQKGKEKKKTVDDIKDDEAEAAMAAELKDTMLSLSRNIKPGELAAEIKAEIEKFQRNAIATGASYTAWAETMRAFVQPDNEEEEEMVVNPFQPDWFHTALDALDSAANQNLFVSVTAPDSGTAKRRNLLDMDKRATGSLDAINYGMTHAITPKSNSTAIAIESEQCISVMQEQVSTWIQEGVEETLRNGVRQFVSHGGRGGGGGLLSDGTTAAIQTSLNVYSLAWQRSARNLAELINKYKTDLVGKDLKQGENFDTAETWSSLFGSSRTPKNTAMETDVENSESRRRRRSTLTSAILGTDVEYFRERLGRIGAAIADFLVGVSTYNRDRHRWYSFVNAAVDYVSNLNSAFLFASHALWLRRWRFDTTAGAKETLVNVIDKGWAIKKAAIGSRELVLAYVDPRASAPDTHSKVEQTIDRILEEYKSRMAVCTESAEIINPGSGSSSSAIATLHLDLDVQVQNLIIQPPELLRNDVFAETAHGSMFDAKENSLDGLVKLTINVLNSPLVDKKTDVPGLNEMRQLIGYENVDNTLEYKILAFMIAAARGEGKETKAIDPKDFKRSTAMDESSSSSSSSSDTAAVEYRNKLIPLLWERFVPSVDSITAPWWDTRVVTLRSLSRWIKIGVTSLFAIQKRNPGQLLPGHDVLWRQLRFAYEVFETLSSNPSPKAWETPALAALQLRLIDTFFIYSASAAIQNQQRRTELGQLEGKIKELLKQSIVTTTTAAAISRVYPVFTAQLDPDFLDVGHLLVPPIEAEEEVVGQSVIERVTGVLKQVGAINANATMASSLSPETDLSVSIYGLFVFGKDTIGSEMAIYFSQLREAFGIVLAAMQTEADGDGQQQQPARRRRIRTLAAIEGEKEEEDIAMQISGKMSGEKLLRAFARNKKNRDDDDDLDGLTGQLQTLQVVDDGNTIVADYKQLDIAFAPSRDGGGMTLRDYLYD